MMSPWRCGNPLRFQPHRRKKRINIKKLFIISCRSIDVSGLLGSNEWRWWCNFWVSRFIKSDSLAPIVWHMHNFTHNKSLIWNHNDSFGCENLRLFEVDTEVIALLILSRFTWCWWWCNLEENLQSCYFLLWFIGMVTRGVFFQPSPNQHL